MSLRSWLYITFLNLFFFANSYAQNIIGTPDILYYDNEDFGAGAQTWMISQDKFGIMYFGNAEGMLTYNGKEWKSYLLPNKTLVRSLKVDKTAKIYVGGQDECGYFFPAANGVLQYHSLKYLFPPGERSLGDVWNISIAGKDIFFRCTDKILHIKPDRKTEIFKTSSHWLYMAEANGKIYAQEEDKGFMQYNNGHWDMLSTISDDKDITGVMNFGKDSLLITTLKNGAYTYCGSGQLMPLKIDSSIINDHIYTAYKINDNNFALGTTSGGVYIIDKHGTTQRHFSRNSGLQNNNILSVFLDKDQNLWLGLDKGINKISINSAIQRIVPIASTPAACYTVRVFNNKILIGTSDGLYTSPLQLPATEDLSLSKGDFSKIGNSGGQVWTLFYEHGQLLMGHTDGTFVIQNNKALPIFKGAGTWLYRDLPGGRKDNINILAGTYYGLHRIKNIHGRIVDSGKVKNGIYESLRFIEIDTINHIVWSAHPYRGIYKIVMKPDMTEAISSKLYTQKDGLPTSLNNYVYSLHGQITFCTDSGLYRYNASCDRFEKAPQYKNIFGNMSLRIIVQDDSDNVWFVSQKKLGVLLRNGQIRYFPEVEGKLIAGFEFIYPMNQQNIFVGSTDGLIHINFEKYRQKHDGIPLLFNKITATGKKDSLLFNGYFTRGDSIYEKQQENNIVVLPALFNSIHFEYVSTEYAQHDNIQYSFQLVGFDKGWSAWNIRNEKDYTNLPYGKYIFRVKARNNFNDTSQTVEYRFTIRPHWYQTNLAYFLYGIVVLLSLFWFRKYQLDKFEKQRLKYEGEQQQLQYLHQLEMEHNEREIINLQKENLENEVSFKNKELASTTMHLYKRGKLLSKLKEELLQVAKNVPEESSRKEVTKLVRMLNEEEKSTNDWEQFSIHFDDVHNNFLSNLKKSYPGLTQADLKICAYIKMNLSSKEIAQLLNISLKGVEVARYRLRRKLNISSPNISLYDVLIGNTN